MELGWIRRMQTRKQLKNRAILFLRIKGCFERIDQSGEIDSRIVGIVLHVTVGFQVKGNFVAL